MRPGHFAVAILLLLVSPLAAFAAAAPDAHPEVDAWVVSTFDLTFSSVTDVELASEFNIHKFTQEGKRYTARDIRDTYGGSNRIDPSGKTGQAFVDQLEADLREQFEDVLVEAFPSATTRTITLVDVDTASLTAANVDAFDPPIRVFLEAEVVRSPAAVGLGNYSSAAIDAVFDAGARVSTDFALKAQAGYHITFRLHAPGDLAFSEPSQGTLSDDARTLSVDRNNLAGTETFPRVSVWLSDPTGVANAPTEEDVRTTVTVSLGALEAGNQDVALAFEVASEVGAIDLSTVFPDGAPLPEKVSLGFLGADAIRALRQTGALSEADLDRMDESLVDRVRKDLARTLTGEVVVSGGILEEDVDLPASAPFGTDPPIRAMVEATGSFRLPEGGENADLALRIGATVNFELNLAEGKRESTVVVRSPPGAAFTGAQGGELAADGSQATFHVPASQAPGTHTVSLSMRDPDAPVFEAEDASIDVLLDLKDLDITLSGAASGDFGNLLMEVTIGGKLGVVRMPDEFSSALPESVELEYLSADAIRLLRERGLVTDADLDRLDATLLGSAAENLRSALGGEVQMTGGIDRATLEAGRVGATLGGDDPVTFTARTTFLKSLSGDPAPQTAAIALYTAPPQTFSLPRVEGRDTTYTIVLPKGLSVASLSAPGADTETGTWSDGREYFRVSPQGESANAAVSMAVTPTFVLAKFWPVVLLALLVLVLLVGTPIAAVVLRRRAKGRSKESKE